MINRLNHSTRRLTISLLAVVFLGLVAVPAAQAATLTVLVDSPTSFRATFTGVDTDASSVAGNDFFGCLVVPCQFKYWSVLMNLRGDSLSGGNANGFYEIQLIHTGSVISDPTAPLINVSLFFTGLAPGTVLSDDKSNSGIHGSYTDTLSTAVDITYDDANNAMLYQGAIAGDTDLDKDGVPDNGDKGATDELVQILNGLKNDGGITGRTKGQAILDSRPRPGLIKKN